jgi:uncharacterized protein (TIGR02246 family)
MRNVVLLTLVVLLAAGGSYLVAPSLAQSQPGKIVPLPPPAPEDPATSKDRPALPKDRPAPPVEKEEPADKVEGNIEKHANKLQNANKLDKVLGHGRTLTPEQQADEKAIRQLGESMAKAYEEGNARAAAAHFTEDAEYVDENGHSCQGQQEIEKCLEEFFSEHATCKLEFSIESIRFVAPNLAVEDGTTRIVHTEGDGPVNSCYTAVHVKQLDGKWLMASLRDRAPKESRREHAAQLKQLDWLLGDWIDEGDDSVVMFACEAVDGGNYLLRKFTVQIAGQESMTGTQRIGWDPVSGKFRVWLFDSSGGYADGSFRRDGDRWILRMSGVTGEGQSASGTSIYNLINDHTMTWQNVDHEVDGEQLPDSEVITIVRQAPKPQIAEKFAE